MHLKVGVIHSLLQSIPNALNEGIKMKRKILPYGSVKKSERQSVRKIIKNEVLELC
jgi:hypothetical protein